VFTRTAVHQPCPLPGTVCCTHCPCPCPCAYPSTHLAILALVCSPGLGLLALARLLLPLLLSAPPLLLSLPLLLLCSGLGSRVHAGWWRRLGWRWEGCWLHARVWWHAHWWWHHRLRCRSRSRVCDGLCGIGAASGGVMCRTICSRCFGSCAVGPCSLMNGKGWLLMGCAWSSQWQQHSF
jgi:hypothetical protein